MMKLMNVCALYMHTEAVKAGVKAAPIACVASAIPIVSVLLMLLSFSIDSIQ